MTTQSTTQASRDARSIRYAIVMDMVLSHPFVDQAWDSLEFSTTKLSGVGDITVFNIKHDNGWWINIKHESDIEIKHMINGVNASKTFADNADMEDILDHIDSLLDPMTTP